MGRFIQVNKSGMESILFGRGAVLAIWKSRNFIVPDGVHKLRVSVLAGGGTGAFGVGTGGMNSASPHFFFAGGGGGGGFSLKIVDVNPGDIIPVTVGAGGGIGASISSRTGGSSSFGIHCSATGGAGGESYYGSGVSGGAVIPGASPGVGAGGDLNFYGGRGGGCLIAGSGGRISTGGGAAGTTYGDGGRGGDVLESLSGNPHRLAATGGGAPASGHGGDRANSTLSTPLYTPGGGVGSAVGTQAPYSTLAAGGGGLFSALAAESRIEPIHPLIPLYGAGAGWIGGSTLTPVTGPGGGGCGSILATATAIVPADAAPSKLCGGSGGVIFTEACTTITNSILSGIGAGSGGAFSYLTNISNQPGGQGLVIVEF